MKRLAIITTHPIQYYAPVFKLLHERQNISIQVFYTWGAGALQKFDPGFGRQVDWDIPLLDGYPYEWVKNASRDPGSHHFNGIINTELIKQIAGWKADAILVFGWAYNGHLKAIRYFHHKIPVLFRGDSTLLDEQGGFKRLLRTIFLRWIYSHVDYALYPGINNKAYLKNNGLKEDQLIFAPHAVDNERFAKKNEDGVIALRSQFGIGDDDILILFAGKFEPKKDPMLLLNSFIALNRSNCHLLFIGSGPLQAHLRQKASDHDGVHFMEFQNQQVMPVAYQACDLFCLPSAGPNETWGLVVNEAMAAGRAVLASDKVGCAPDLVNESIGLIFPGGNGGMLTNALEQLTRSKTQLIQYGKNAAVAIRDWNFTKQAEAIEEIVLNIHDNL